MARGVKMLVSINMSNEVYDYFKGYDFNSLANALLEKYDYTDLPQTSGKKDKQVTVNITDEFYIQLYLVVGPRSKKISLGRLFEFAYNMQVLNEPVFIQSLIAQDPQDIANSYLTRAYNALLEAQKFDKSYDLGEITNYLYNYKSLRRRY